VNLPQRINLFTFGCAKNLYDTEVLMGKLASNNISLMHEAELKENDIVIVNTCGFINDAKQESINAIFEFIEAKKNGYIKDVMVFGCLSERYKAELIKEIPEINHFFGVFSYKEILKALNLTDNGQKRRVLTTPSHYAYLKISDGCNQKCSFCAIPLIKGKLKSETIESLSKEAEWLVSQNVKEIILVSQDTTSYGKDIYGKDSLIKLIDRISEIDHLEWLRIHYLYPNKFPLELIDRLNTVNTICRYMDLPIQHISTRILKLMRRDVSSLRIHKLLNFIREKSPETAIRTTLLVGHPGETDKEFDELCDFVRDFEFDRLGVFTYSQEEGTFAASLKDNIPQNVKAERASIIMSLQSEISLKKNQSKVGKTIKVIIDRKENDFFIGRSEFDSPEVDNEVIVTDSNELSVGNFYHVEITGCHINDLNAKYHSNA